MNDPNGFFTMTDVPGNGILKGFTLNVPRVGVLTTYGAPFDNVGTYFPTAVANDGATIEGHLSSSPASSVVINKVITVTQDKSNDFAVVQKPTP